MGSYTNIKKISMDVILLVLTFYEISVVPHLIFIVFKYCVLLYLLVTYCQFVKSNKVISLTIIIYGLSLMIPTFINNMPINNLISSFFVGIQIFDIYAVFNKALKKYDYKALIKLIFKTFIIILLINDFMILIIDYDFANSSTRYFIGDKFTVSYVHFFITALAFIVFYWNVKKLEIKINNITVVIFICLISLFCIIKVECVTGLLSYLFMLIIMMIPIKMKKVIINPIFLLGLIAIVNILFFGLIHLFWNTEIQNFLVSLLNKTPSLSGRTQIWDIIFYYINQKPIFGYGYFNTIIKDALGYGNPQNGVLKSLLDTGIFGLITLALLIYFSLNKSNKHFNLQIFYIYAFIVSMLVASLVEISLNHPIFFVSLSLVYNYKKEAYYKTDILLKKK